MPASPFNGNKYDINSIKQYLHKSLEDCGEAVSFTNIKCKLKTPRLQFLDIRS
jgi:hypothetical protein